MYVRPSSSLVLQSPSPPFHSSHAASRIGVSPTPARPAAVSAAASAPFTTTQKRPSTASLERDLLSPFFQGSTSGPGTTGSVGGSRGSSVSAAFASAFATTKGRGANDATAAARARMNATTAAAVSARGGSGVSATPSSSSAASSSTPQTRPATTAPSTTPSTNPSTTPSPAARKGWNGAAAGSGAIGLQLGRASPASVSSGMARTVVRPPQSAVAKSTPFGRSGTPPQITRPTPPRPTSASPAIVAPPPATAPTPAALSQPLPEDLTMFPTLAAAAASTPPSSRPRSRRASLNMKQSSGIRATDASHGSSSPPMPPLESVSSSSPPVRARPIPLHVFHGTSAAAMTEFFLSAPAIPHVAAVTIPATEPATDEQLRGTDEVVTEPSSATGSPSATTAVTSPSGDTYMLDEFESATVFDSDAHVHMESHHFTPRHDPERRVVDPSPTSTTMTHIASYPDVSPLDFALSPSPSPSLDPSSSFARTTAASPSFDFNIVVRAETLAKSVTSTAARSTLLTSDDEEWTRDTDDDDAWMRAEEKSGSEDARRASMAARAHSRMVAAYRQEHPNVSSLIFADAPTASPPPPNKTNEGSEEEEDEFVML